MFVFVAQSYCTGHAGAGAHEEAYPNFTVEYAYLWVNKYLDKLVLALSLDLGGFGPQRLLWVCALHQYPACRTDGNCAHLAS